MLTLLCLVAAGTSAEEIVPSEICRGLWVVPAVFGGETLSLVLDTGAESTHVTPESLARVLGAEIEVGKKHVLRNGRIGPLRVGKIRVTASELDHLGRALGRDIDGILGMSAFRSLLLTLDYGTQEVRVGKGRLPRVDGEEIFRDVGSIRPMLRIDIGGNKEKLLIDSGSTGQFDLVPDERLEWVVEPRPINAAARYNRIEIDEVGRMAGTIRFGSAVFQEPIVERADRISLVGFDVMKHFVWTFDKVADRIRIRPISGEEIRMDSVRGLGVAFNPLPEGFEVIEILEGTQEAASGLQKGDLVTHQDGVPMGERNCRKLGDDPEQREATFTVQRGGVTHEITVSVVELIP